MRVNLPEPRQSWIELDAFMALSTTDHQIGIFFWVGGDTYIIMMRERICYTTRDSVLLTPSHRTSITTHLLHDKRAAVCMWKAIKQVL